MLRCQASLQAPGPSARRALPVKLRRKDKALAEIAALIVLKKALEIWGPRTTTRTRRAPSNSSARRRSGECGSEPDGRHGPNHAPANSLSEREHQELVDVSASQNIATSLRRRSCRFSLIEISTSGRSRPCTVSCVARSSSVAAGASGRHPSSARTHCGAGLGNLRRGTSRTYGAIFEECFSTWTGSRTCGAARSLVGKFTRSSLRNLRLR